MKIEKIAPFNCYWLRLLNGNISIPFNNLVLGEQKGLNTVTLMFDDRGSCFLHDEQADEFYKLWKELNND